MHHAHILVVAPPDRRAAYRAALSDLGDNSHGPAFEINAVAAGERITSDSFDLLVVSLAVDEPAALRLIELARKARAALPVIVVATSPSIESAQQAMRSGAGDYLTEPFTRD
ncbi:MAG: hypothetical protein K2Y37_25550, partial [Pirellulales bacterium]|nr:hypothetical protein [Pirellulales bacterium]